MDYSTFSKHPNDARLEPMFLGQPVNVARYDQQKYEVFEKLTERQLSFFWRPEEIDVSRDRIDFMNLPEHEKHIFTSNLKYQTLLDSIQGRSPNVALLPLVSIPELETWIESWAFSETIHSRSYTHIIRNIYPNPSEVLDGVVENEAILKRAETIAHYYDDLIEYAQLFNLLGEGVHTVNGRQVALSKRELKKKLYLCLMCVNVLEAIRFYVSFACSFAFAERELMEGNAKIIKLIARDECFVPETEVATPTGWKRVDQITTDDLVGQYNVETQSIEFVRPERTVRSHTREIHHYESAYISQSVTPNHRIIYLNKQLEHREAESHKYKPHSLNFSLTSGYLKGQVHTLTPFERLLIAAQADGSMNKRYTGTICGTLPIVFSFSKQRKIDRLLEIVGTCGFNWVEQATSPAVGKKKSRRVFRINVPLDQIKGINIKDFSTWIDLKEKSADWCREFIQELVYWDGYIPKDPTIRYVYYSTTKKANADLVQLVGVMGGYSVTRGTQEDRRKATFNTIYRCYFFKDKTFRRNGCVEKQVEHLDDERPMYCLSVPSKALLTRHNDKVVVSGNCLHLTGTQHMLNLMKSGTDDAEMAEIAAELEGECCELFKKAAAQEKEWAEYLFKDGSMIGLNKEILSQYVEYITNLRMQAVGLKPAFEGANQNPIPWINAWLSSDNVQVAPQEVEISSYLIGQIDAEVKPEDLGNFEL